MDMPIKVILTVYIRGVQCKLYMRPKKITILLGVSKHTVIPEHEYKARDGWCFPDMSDFINLLDSK